MRCVSENLIHKTNPPEIPCGACSSFGIEGRGCFHAHLHIMAGAGRTSFCLCESNVQIGTSFCRCFQAEMAFAMQVSPVALNTSENILMCAPTGAGKTNVAMLSILHTLSLYRRKDGSVDASKFKIIYVAPMKVHRLSMHCISRCCLASSDDRLRILVQPVP